MHVRRIRPERTDGGIVIVHDYTAKRNPRLTLGARPDYWPAEVKAVGPEVRELSPGDKVYVYAFAEDTGSKMGLYTGHKVGADELLVDADKDIVCAVEDAPW